VEELQEQHSILRNTIEQFRTSESLRATLLSHLKEALHEQVCKSKCLCEVLDLVDRFMDIQMFFVMFEFFSGVQNGTSQTPTSGMFVHSTMLFS
jgi:hypothetical protein